MRKQIIISFLVIMSIFLIACDDNSMNSLYLGENTHGLIGQAVDPYCIDTDWTPDEQDFCVGEDVLQTSNCGRTRVVGGGKLPDDCGNKVCGNASNGCSCGTCSRPGIPNEEGNADCLEIVCDNGQCDYPTKDGAECVYHDDCPPPTRWDGKGICDYDCKCTFSA